MISAAAPPQQRLIHDHDGCAVAVVLLRDHDSVRVTGRGLKTVTGFRVYRDATANELAAAGLSHPAAQAATRRHGRPRRENRRRGWQCSTGPGPRRYAAGTDPARHRAGSGRSGLAAGRGAAATEAELRGAAPPAARPARHCMQPPSQRGPSRVVPLGPALEGPARPTRHGLRLVPGAVGGPPRFRAPARRNTSRISRADSEERPAAKARRAQVGRASRAAIAAGRGRACARGPARLGDEAGG